MDTEANKQVASTFFACFTAGDVGGALATMTEDATWLIPGQRAQFPSAGLHDKKRIARLFHAMSDRLKGGLTMSVDSAIAEGDKVALEVQSHGELTNGNRYAQRYHFLMQFRDGKICAVREYLDTQHAFATWFEPAPTSAKP